MLQTSCQRGIEFKIVQKVEDIGLAVAEQMEPNQDGYKALTISSGGKVGQYENIRSIIIPVILTSY